MILYSIYRETRALQRATDECDDEEFSEQIDALAEEIVDEAKAAAETLDGARFGTFNVLSAGLHYDYSWQLNTARRIRNRYEGEIDEETADALQNLIDTLKFFATGREYFQSLYYKREVARLSSNLLFVSLPVIVLISYLLLALDANIIPIFRIGPLTSLPVFVLLVYTLSLAPYVVLTAYVIRVAAITLRTLAAGPFLVRQPTTTTSSNSRSTSTRTRGTSRRRTPARTSTAATRPKTGSTSPRSADRPTPARTSRRRATGPPRRGPGAPTAATGSDRRPLRGGRVRSAGGHFRVTGGRFR
ncbi:hypothetical protein ACFQL4_27595 [Halosimplex aquaticum]